MNLRIVRSFEFFLLAGLLALGTPAFAAGTGAPLVYRSAPTEEGSPPAAVRSTAGTRLVASDTGRYVVPFTKEDGGDGSFVYLGFSFTAKAPYAVTVTTEKPVASIRVFANGAEALTAAGSLQDWVVAKPPSGTQEVVVRLERGASRLVPVTVSLSGFQYVASLSPNPTGEILSAPPEELVWDLGAATRPAERNADLFVPAVIHSEGLHGPIRTRLALLNHAGATVRVGLALLSSEGGSPDSVKLDLPPRSTTALDDVVAYVRGEGVSDQGVLAIRGFVPGSPGDLVAETSYVNESGGRIGTTLPLFSESPARFSSVILSASQEGEPRLILFSDASRLGSAVPRVARIHVETASGDHVAPVTFLGGFSLTKRLSDLVPGAAPEGIVAVETDDPTIHAVIVRNDAVTGSPFVYASN
ncbi:MAG TPA: hypothetical protein VGR00_09100 [Thermoanaerobaculia bacterium]|jgi:hypothetical protein|nr:hypothetical protein [Thermoanaerobaculia bacterium]